MLAPSPPAGTMRLGRRPFADPGDTLLLRRHAAAGASALVAAVLFGAPAVAQPASEECARADEAAKILSQVGKQREAREKLVVCAAPACPRAVRDSCADRLAALDKAAAMPSLVFVVTDTEGNDLAAVRVTMDGKPLLERVDVPATSVDVGEHYLRFEANGFAPADKRIVAREGERDRRITVQLERATSPRASETPAPEPPPSTPPALAPPPPAPAQAAPPPPAPAPPPSSETAPARGRVGPLVVATGAVGVAGLAVGVIVGLAATSKYSTLSNECNGTACPASAQGDLDAFRSMRTVSTVGYVVGIVGVAGAAALYFLLPQGHAGTATAHAWIGPTPTGFAGEF